MASVIKKTGNYHFYLKLIVTVLAVLLCLYVFSVNAAGQQVQKKKFQLPTKVTLAVTSDKTHRKIAVKYNLKLQVSLPESLMIRDSAIHWQIYRDNRIQHQLTGQQHDLNLPAGNYVIHLQIGKYKTSKRMRIRNNQQLRPYFKANLGRLQLAADYPVKWSVTGPGKLHYKTDKRYKIDEIVPAGEYRIKAFLPTLVQQKKVRVGKGKLAKQKLTLPLGTVSLMAVRNNQPLLQPMEWEIFRLDHHQRHRIGRYYQHANRISIPPGQYEAVVRYRNNTSKRRFWVQQETSHNVILVVD
ncbi:MAG: hypothetical protein CSA79_04205 [Thiothrix nivea]|nr:MAG: hypothetical protein CSA79_04205 [Thiothrix nivea]